MTPPLVLVSVGTDHHPFDRLVAWVDSWVDAQAGDVELVVQHGTSRPSRTGENYTIIPRTRLLELFREATVVVTQVGPGTILDANSVSRRPIVMARDPRLGEAVDGHQVPFGHFMADRGTAWITDSEAGLHTHLDRALEDPAYSRVPERHSPADQTAAAMQQVVDDVLSRRPGWFKFSRLPQVRQVRPERPAPPEHVRSSS